MSGPPVATVEQSAMACQVAAQMFRAAVARDAEFGGPGFEDMTGHQVVVDIDRMATALWKVRADGERFLVVENIVGVN